MIEVTDGEKPFEQSCTACRNLKGQDDNLPRAVIKAGDSHRNVMVLCRACVIEVHTKLGEFLKAKRKKR
jgi:hypothetical protein